MMMVSSSCPAPGPMSRNEISILTPNWMPPSIRAPLKPRGRKPLVARQRTFILPTVDLNLKQYLDELDKRIYSRYMQASLPHLRTRRGRPSSSTTSTKLTKSSPTGKPTARQSSILSSKEDTKSSCRPVLARESVSQTELITGPIATRITQTKTKSIVKKDINEATDYFKYKKENAPVIKCFTTTGDPKPWYPPSARPLRVDISHLKKSPRRKITPLHHRIHKGYKQILPSKYKTVPDIGSKLHQEYVSLTDRSSGTDEFPVQEHLTNLKSKIETYKISKGLNSSEQGGDSCDSHGYQTALMPEYSRLKSGMRAHTPSEFQRQMMPTRSETRSETLLRTSEVHCTSSGPRGSNQIVTENKETGIQLHLQTTVTLTSLPASAGLTSLPIATGVTVTQGQMPFRNTVRMEEKGIQTSRLSDGSSDEESDDDSVITVMDKCVQTEEKEMPVFVHMNVQTDEDRTEQCTMSTQTDLSRSETPEISRPVPRSVSSDVGIEISTQTLNIPFQTLGRGDSADTERMRQARLNGGEGKQSTANLQNIRDCPTFLKDVPFSYEINTVLQDIQLRKLQLKGNVDANIAVIRPVRCTKTVQPYPADSSQFKTRIQVEINSEAIINTSNTTNQQHPKSSEKDKREKEAERHDQIKRVPIKSQTSSPLLATMETSIEELGSQQPLLLGIGPNGGHDEVVKTNTNENEPDLKSEGVEKTAKLPENIGQCQVVDAELLQERASNPDEVRDAGGNQVEAPCNSLVELPSCDANMLKNRNDTGTEISMAGTETEMPQQGISAETDAVSLKVNSSIESSNGNKKNHMSSKNSQDPEITNDTSTYGECNENVSAIESFKSDPKITEVNNGSRLDANSNLGHEIISSNDTNMNQERKLSSLNADMASTDNPGSVSMMQDPAALHANKRNTLDLAVSVPSSPGLEDITKGKRDSLDVPVSVHASPGPEITLKGKRVSLDVPPSAPSSPRSIPWSKRRSLDVTISDPSSPVAEDMVNMKRCSSDITLNRTYSQESLHNKAINVSSGKRLFFDTNISVEPKVRDAEPVQPGCFTAKTDVVSLYPEFERPPIKIDPTIHEEQPLTIDVPTGEASVLRHSRRKIHDERRVHSARVTKQEMAESEGYTFHSGTVDEAKARLVKQTSRSQLRGYKSVLSKKESILNIRSRLANLDSTDSLLANQDSLSRTSSLDSLESINESFFMEPSSENFLSSSGPSSVVSKNLAESLTRVMSSESLDLEIETTIARVLSSAAESIVSAVTVPSKTSVNSSVEPAESIQDFQGMKGEALKVRRPCSAGNIPSELIQSSEETLTPVRKESMTRALSAGNNTSASRKASKSSGPSTTENIADELTRGFKNTSSMTSSGDRCDVQATKDLHEGLVSRKSSTSSRPSSAVRWDVQSVKNPQEGLVSRKESTSSRPSSAARCDVQSVKDAAEELVPRRKSTSSRPSSAAKFDVQAIDDRQERLVSRKESTSSKLSSAARCDVPSVKHPQEGLVSRKSSTSSRRSSVARCDVQSIKDALEGLVSRKSSTSSRPSSAARCDVQSINDAPEELVSRKLSTSSRPSSSVRCDVQSVKNPQDGLVSRKESTSSRPSSAARCDVQSVKNAAEELVPRRKSTSSRPSSAAKCDVQSVKDAEEELVPRKKSTSSRPSSAVIFDVQVINDLQERLVSRKESTSSRPSSTGRCGVERTRNRQEPATIRSSSTGDIPQTSAPSSKQDSYRKTPTLAGRDTKLNSTFTKDDYITEDNSNEETQEPSRRIRKNTFTKEDVDANNDGTKTDDDNHDIFNRTFTLDTDGEPEQDKADHSRILIRRGTFTKESEHQKEKEDRYEDDFESDAE